MKRVACDASIFNLLFLFAPAIDDDIEIQSVSFYFQKMALLVFKRADHCIS